MRGVETENRYFEAGMKFVSLFMFIAWNALLTNLTFGKGGSLRFTYEYNLIYISPLFLLLIQKELKLQQLAKTKSKIHIQHPAMGIS